MVKTTPRISSKDDDTAPPRRRTGKRAQVRNARIVPAGEESQDPDNFDAVLEDIEDELRAVNFDNMDKEGLLMEIQRVDKEYLRINSRLTLAHKRRRHVIRGDLDALNIQLRTLKQRSDMLFKCLDKVLPDKRETTIDLTLKSTEVDQIPDDILMKISLGTITEDEYEHYQHLFDKDLQKKEEDTKH